MWNSFLESNRKGKNVSDEIKDDIARALEETLKFSTLQSSSTSITRDNKRPQLFPQSCSWLIDMCFACHSYKLLGMRYINLNDGRKMCPDCHSLAVLDFKKANVVFDKVHKFYDDMKIKVDKNIPFFLADQIDMGEVYVSGGGTKGRLIYGLTIFTPCVFKSVKSSSLRFETIEVIKKTEKLRNQDVTVMLVLYGLSVLETGSTLAHEMMHTWLGRKVAVKLDRKLNEGICEVMAHKWIDWYDFKADKSFSYTSEQIQFLEKLKRSIKSRIEENPDKIYGDGFRDVNRAVERYGLKYTLKFIVRNMRLPSKESTDEETENKTLRQSFVFKLISVLKSSLRSKKTRFKSLKKALKARLFRNE